MGSWLAAVFTLLTTNCPRSRNLRTTRFRRKCAARAVFRRNAIIHRPEDDERKLAFLIRQRKSRGRLSSEAETFFERLEALDEILGGYTWIADVAKPRKQLTASGTHPSDENHKSYNGA